MAARRLWDRRPVPAGHTRSVVVDFAHPGRFPRGVRRICWNDERAVVRTPEGVLRWWEDSTRHAYRDVEDHIRVVSSEDEPGYPRHYESSPDVEALAVRSLADFLDDTDFERVEATEDDRSFTVNPVNSEPGNLAYVRLSLDSGAILEAHGVESGHPWRIEVLEERLVPGDDLLRIADLT